MIQDPNKVFLSGFKHPLARKAVRFGRHQDGSAMLKYLSIGALFFTLGTSAGQTQQQEAVLRRVQTSIAGFDIWLAVPTSEGRLVYPLGASPDALIVHLIGGELVLVFDDAYDMASALEILKSPIAASHVMSKDGKSRTPFAIYGLQRAE